MKQHVGVILEKAVRNSDISISELAKRLNVNRKTIYNWFNQPNIRTEILSKVGSIISCEFSSNLPGTTGNLSYTKTNTTVSDESNPWEMADHWKNKYMYLLEKYNDFIVNKENRNFLNANQQLVHRERV